MTDELDQLAPALVAALSEMDELPRTRTAKVDTKGGGSYSYSYADLGDTLGYVRPILARHGLVAVQDATGTNGSVSVCTTVVHVSGQRLTYGPLGFPAGATPQATGSALTYARRYSLLAALGLATEDDDGAAASKAPKRRASRHGGAVSAEPSSGPSSAQTRKAMALFAEAGWGERSARLAFTSAVLDRDIDSWTDVSGDEARQVIDALEAEVGRDNQ